ncbi:hypothetical protein PV376_22385 [Streptomyces sp. NRRL_ISP-5395]|uniref:hypothetical protein n=1 Tax=Streptomyces TaxID=1883 RepID=UPI001993254A|nr:MULTISPECIES: hypothetical protein [Streptomyces]MDX2672251.1 hypothetical protein [Streptomyces sp. NRRL_ISP-5395]GHF55206.1 hypothetical protein GCM10010504_23960 [Streptomyces griseus]
MPTFEQLLTARLAPLATAVTQWTEMIGKLKSPLQTDAKAMESKAGKSSWAGDNASVTKEFVTKTANEFSDAVTEAESVRDLLSDAHTTPSSSRLRTISSTRLRIRRRASSSTPTAFSVIASTPIDAPRTAPNPSPPRLSSRRCAASSKGS